MFEVTRRSPYGVVLRQQVPESEVVWIPGPSEPVTIIGDWTWTTYIVTAVAMLPSTRYVRADDVALSDHATPIAYVSVGGLVRESGIAIGGNQPDSGVFLQLKSNKLWALIKKTKGGSIELATGRVAIVSNDDTWVELRVAFMGEGKITAYINNNQVANVTDKTYTNGWAALGCSWDECLYRSFSITK